MNTTQKMKGFSSAIGPELILSTILLVTAVALSLSSPHYMTLFTFAAIYLIAATGLNMLVGYAGIISIGHGAVVCVGAYVTAIACVSHGWGFWPAATLGSLAGLAVSVLIGLPALRLSSWYYVLITVAFAFVVPGLLVDLRSITGGYAGVVGIPTPDLGPMGSGLQGLFVIVLAIAALLAWVVRNVTVSRIGRALMALHDGNEGAGANGVSTSRLKLFAFAFSGMAAGLAGAFYAAAKTVITPEEFGLDFSFLFLVIVVVGGSGRLAGPLFGVAIFYVLPELLTFLREYRLIVFGVGLLACSVLIPDGFAGLLSRLANRKGRRNDASEASETQDATIGDAPRVQGASLSLSNVGIRFGGVVAVDGVTLDIAAGSIHVVVGPNGSGKTTLLNLISGFHAVSAGSIQLDERDITGLRPRQVASLGVQRTFQTPKLLPSLSLLENVCFGAYTREKATGLELAFNLPRARRERLELEQDARHLLRIVGLARLAHLPASELTHGQQRLAEIARALMARPRLILLDEPAAGLSMGELERLGDLLREIRKLGATLVMVEHHLELVADVADHVTVLERGRILASGSADEVFHDERVVAAYMGVSR